MDKYQLIKKYLKKKQLPLIIKCSENYINNEIALKRLA